MVILLNNQPSESRHNRGPYFCACNNFRALITVVLLDIDLSIDPKGLLLHISHLLLLLLHSFDRSGAKTWSAVMSVGLIQHLL